MQATTHFLLAVACNESVKKEAAGKPTSPSKKGGGAKRPGSGSKHATVAEEATTAMAVAADEPSSQEPPLQPPADPELLRKEASLHYGLAVRLLEGGDKLPEPLNEFAGELLKQLQQSELALLTALQYPAKAAR